MKDGTAEFKTVDARVAAIFDLIYPVGSVFATTGIAPELGTWEEIAQGRALQGADSSHAAGSTVEAGLPNIEGRFDDNIGYANTGIPAEKFYGPMAFGNPASSLIGQRIGATNDDQNYYHTMIFNASKANPIYGNSSTVQPPAYIVHFYRRIA